MPIPDKYPQWAVNDVIDPTSGQNNVADPDLSDPSKKLEGWAFKEFPPRQWFNFLHRLVNDWTEYFNADLFDNTPGNDNRNLTVRSIGSADAISTDMNIDVTDDLDINVGDQIDITCSGNFTMEGGDIWIDSGNYLYLEGAYEVDITGGDYILMSAGVAIDLSAPEVTSGGIIHASGGSSGFRVNSGKIMTEYREGSTTVGTDSTGTFIPDAPWTWRWRRHDNIIDLIMEYVEGELTATFGQLIYSPVPADIFDAPLTDITLYERAAAISWCQRPTIAGSLSTMVTLSMSRIPGLTFYLRFHEGFTAGTGFSFGKMHFRYEVRN